MPSRRYSRAILWGTIATLLLVLITGLILCLFNPFTLLGHTTNRVLAFLEWPIHAPVVLVVLIIVWLCACGAAILSARPLALRAYMREVCAAQEEYHKLYTPLTAVTNIRTADHRFVEEDDDRVITQERQVSILDLVQQNDMHQLLLGVPGAGKTMALRVYQYITSQRSLGLFPKRQRIPVYVPMKNYSLFLKQRLPEVANGEGVDAQEVILPDYLVASDLPGMQHLRPYVHRLAKQGKLLLLCDGLNEIDSNYLTHVSGELVQLMHETNNRLVMTCREVDYGDQHDLVQMVNEGQVSRVVIYPLLPEQVHEFVERYVEKQDRHWQHTAGQILQVIDRSRLRYHCTNPMMLFTLMRIIDKIGVERGKQIDTRGRLLREYVKQLLEYEQQQGRWSEDAPDEYEVVRFLGEVACAARWANDRNAIQLPVSSIALTSAEGHSSLNFDELADELRYWLDEHPAQEPFTTEGYTPLPPEPYNDLARLLQFALSAGLIDISPGGVLSFRHELIAEYFVAEYFFAVTDQQRDTLPIRAELLENVGRWSEPVAIWAGLLDQPLVLADHFGALGRSNPAYVLQALALALVCVGVLWTPPQAEIQRVVTLPSSVEDALSIAVRNRAAREELARIFTRCAEEGGQEVYRSLLPLVMVEGVDDLLTLLDQTIVPDLLFAHLQDAVDTVAYDAQVKRLTRILGRFDGLVVERASQLCQPAPERSLRLRAAAVNILGGTADARAVELLIARLSDAEPYIVERATNALIRLGPELTLTQLLQLLENRTPSPYLLRIHRAVLIALERYMDEPNSQRQLSAPQYQRVLDTIMPVLTSHYKAEPETQQFAREVLSKQSRKAVDDQEGEQRATKVLQALIGYLSSSDELAVGNVKRVLQEVGQLATPYLLDLLVQQSSDEVRLSIVDILKSLHDLRALPVLMDLLAQNSPALQEQVTEALYLYAPESIDGLIHYVLTSPSEIVAERASQILSSLGSQAAVPVADALEPIVPERTRLLVQVLEHLRDTGAIPALVDLLRRSQNDPLLALVVVRALSQFAEPRVIPPLLTMLTDANPLLYEEAINALSQLGGMALPELLAALDHYDGAVIIPRVRRAILGMDPFPGEELVQALGQCSDLQAQQIILIFQMQKTEAAHVLVLHIDDSNSRVRDYVLRILNDMPGAVVVPALLEIFSQPSLYQVASGILLHYPESAISPLVELLGEQERGEAAVALLPQFGPRVLRLLISGLDDPRSAARDRARRIILALVEQSSDQQSILRELLQLFNPEPPARAREVLLNVLCNELSTISLLPLLDALDDAYLLDDVAEALVRLASQPAYHQQVLEALLNALLQEEKRRGAATALVRIGAPAVAPLDQLITHSDPGVARIAKEILREIGVPALSLIWNAHSDTTNLAHRDAALEIFHSMRTDVIKDELVTLLTSDEPNQIAMAVTLLLERIHDEAVQHYADRVMIAELIEYVQKNGVEETNLRIMALLLLLGEHSIIDQLVQTLDEYPQQRKQLLYALLLFGAEAHESLLDVFNDSDSSIELRAELAAVLGMEMAPEEIVEYAQSLSSYGMAVTRTEPLFPDQLEIALRALGGLLAGGHWNLQTLQELREESQNGPAYELYSILLGWQFGPQLNKLRSELEQERDAHKKEVVAMTTRVVMDQKRVLALEDEIEAIQREHGFRNEEYDQLAQEINGLQQELEQMERDRAKLQAEFRRVLKDNEALREHIEQLNWQLDNQGS